MAAGSSNSVWADYLHDKETIVSERKIGFYDVVATSDRVLFLRRILKSYSEARYEDIHSLSHRTRPNWNRLFKAFLWFAVGIYAFRISPLNGSTVLTDSLSEVIRNYLKELAFLPVSQLTSVFVLLILLNALRNLLSFLPTMQGVFIITLKAKSPIRVSTSLTREVRLLMKDIESGMSAVSVAVGRPTPSPQDTRQAQATPSLEVDSAASIAEALSDTTNNPIVLIQSKSENHVNSVISALKALVSDGGKTGVYIALSRPYSKIVEDFTRAGIDESKLLFIDAISYMTGEQPKESDSAVFIENPSSLEEVGMYLDMYLEKKKPSFVFFDSLDSLMIYNDQKTVSEFTHYLINKMRLDNLSGVILTLKKKEVEGLVKTLIPLCDKEVVA